MNETMRLIASWLIAALSIGWGLRITVFQQQYIRSLVRKREKYKPMRPWLMGPNVYHTCFFQFICYLKTAVMFLPAAAQIRSDGARVLVLGLRNFIYRFK